MRGARAVALALEEERCACAKARYAASRAVASLEGASALLLRLCVVLCTSDSYVLVMFSLLSLIVARTILFLGVKCLCNSGTLSHFCPIYIDRYHVVVRTVEVVLFLFLPLSGYLS